MDSIKDQRMAAGDGSPPASTAALAPASLDAEKPEQLAEAAIHKFLTIQRHLRQYASRMDHHGVRPWEFSVLLFLQDNGPATVGQVQEFLYHSPSNTSTILSQMEDAGYVTRTRSADDNRVVIVALTAAGSEVARQGPVGGIPLLRRRLPSLSPQRLAAINQALEDMMELMEVTDSA